MNRLLTLVMLSIVCFAASAEEEKVISVLCNGVKLDSFFGKETPITTTYLFKLEKNPRKDNKMAWSMQENGERRQYQEKIDSSKTFKSLSILVSDHSVLFTDELDGVASRYNNEGKINRISGDWQIKYAEYKKQTNGFQEITRTINTTGKCQAATPKF